MINKNELKHLQQALTILEAGFTELPEFTPAFDEDAVASVLAEVATRLQDNYPYYHPQYAGQMLKPPHPVARIAYALSLWINPNNHALDGGRASSAMEKECIVELGSLFGWRHPLGHLTGGGTMANLEALWVAGKLHPGKRVVASEQAHYTHQRITDVLGIPFSPVAVRSPRPHGYRRAGGPAAAGRCRYRRRHDGQYRARQRRPAAGGAATARRLRVSHPRRRRLRRLLRAGRQPVCRDGNILCGTDARRFDRHRPAQTRAAALRLRLRTVPGRVPSAVSTNTARRTPISVPPSCISAKSASNAPVPALRPSRCGPRSACCRFAKTANSPRGSAAP